MKSLRFILAAALVSLAVACTSAPRNGVPEKIKPTKNLIVMITDGTFPAPPDTDGSDWWKSCK